MRYLVKERVKSGKEQELLPAITDRTHGQGSIAGEEYVYDLQHARVGDDGSAQ